LVDYFTPYNQLDLANTDADLGSGAVIVLPPERAPGRTWSSARQTRVHLPGQQHQHGSFQRGNVERLQIVQSFNGIAGSFGTPAYFNNMLYYVGAGDKLKAFRFSGGLLVTARLRKAVIRLPGQRNAEHFC